MRRHWTVRNLQRVVGFDKGDGWPQIAVNPGHGEAEHGPARTWERAGTLRRARRIADLSQRALADRIGVSPATIARAELDNQRVSLGVIEAILDAAGLRLVVVNTAGEVVQPMRVDAARDNGGSRYPAHLDAHLPGVGPDWFPERDDRPAPRLAFHHRQWRDVVRARLRLLPRDHSSEFELCLSHYRGRYRRRPPWMYARDRPEPEPCECGPECERHCVSACPCQCEPAGVDVLDIRDLYDDAGPPD